MTGSSLEADADGVEQAVHTGVLPGWHQVETDVVDAYERYRSRTSGVVADYIPALAAADPELFAVSVAEVGGAVHVAGEADVEFSIQSISKAFVYAMVCEELGHHLVRERLGVNNTGLSFNSVIAIELNDGHPMNPMVNAGALATTALVPRATPAEQWERIRTAGSPDSLDANSRSTARSITPRCSPISAIKPSPDCSRATAASTSILSTWWTPIRRSAL